MSTTGASGPLGSVGKEIDGDESIANEPAPFQLGRSAAASKGDVDHCNLLPGQLRILLSQRARDSKSLSTRASLYR